jgi:hypothetical protein
VRVLKLHWATLPVRLDDSAFVRDRLVATIAKIPPVPQFLASMVAGTAVDPFAGTGLRELDWLLQAVPAGNAVPIESETGLR